MTDSHHQDPTGSTTAALSGPAYRHVVMVTEAPFGVPATVLGRLATSDLHTVTYVPSPGRLAKGGVATDALEALGKDNDMRGKSRHPHEESELLQVWLTAHRTRYLIPVACQRTPRENLLHLVDLTKTSPTSLLFAVDHGFGDQLMTALAAVAPTLVDWPTPRSGSSASGHDTATDNASAHWYDTEPVLPVIEYWTFYATAKRQLTPQSFAPVHSLYCDTLSRTNHWLNDLALDGAEPDITLAYGCLKTLIQEQSTFDNVTVVIRAAQAAFHRAGWFLNVDERELRNGLIRFNPTASSPVLYNRLRAYRDPSRAATVALYLAGATPAAIRDVSLDDLAHWHQNSQHQVAGIHVPEAASPYLRANLLARANDAHKPDRQAFLGGERRVNLDIRQAARDLDLNIGDANLNETSTINARRVPKNMIKMEALR